MAALGASKLAVVLWPLLCSVLSVLVAYRLGALLFSEARLLAHPATLRLLALGRSEFRIQALRYRVPPRIELFRLQP